MDEFTLGVLVRVATCLYGVFGFLISILAALAGLLDRRPTTAPPLERRVKSKKPLRPQLRSKPSRTIIASPPRSPIRSFSERVHQQPKSILNQPSSESDVAAVAAARKRMLASHRRSRSIPIITIDYFGSTDNLWLRPSESSSNTDSELRVSARKPLTFVLSPPDRERRPRASSAGSEKSTSRLSSSALKANGSVPRRRVSNPQLSELPMKGKKAPMRRAKSSEFEGRASLGSDFETKPRKKLLRRLSDAPLEERLTTRFELTFLGSSEKKKLRTNPYESSFYCPTPAPIRTIRKAATVGDLTKVANKLSKSQAVIR